MEKRLFTITANDREWVLAYTDGTFSETLTPGRHRRHRRTQYVPVAKAERLTSLKAQEVLTADGIQVKTTAAVRWHVSDPVAFHETAAEPDDMLYLATQIAVRTVVSELTVDQLHTGVRSDELGARLLALVTPEVAALGIEPRGVVIRDLILPAELRAATLELSSARIRGAAQLEAARSETAVLRSMANAAKLLDEHPALANLRLVQSLPMGSQVQLDVR